MDIKVKFLRVEKITNIIRLVIFGLESKNNTIEIGINFLQKASVMEFLRVTLIGRAFCDKRLHM